MIAMSDDVEVGLPFGCEAGGFTSHYRGSERTRGMPSGVCVCSDLAVWLAVLLRCPVMGCGDANDLMVCVV